MTGAVGEQVFLQPWIANRAGRKHFPPFRISFLDSGVQRGQFSWDANVASSWTDPEPEWGKKESEGLTGDWLGAASTGDFDALEVEAVPDVVAALSFVPKEQVTVDDVEAFVLLDHADDILPNLMWSADGGAFYVLRRSGTLHKVRIGGFREEYRLRLFEEASSMALTGRGLAVAVPGSQLIRVLAPDNLRTLTTVRVPGVHHLASSPRLGVVFATEGGRAASLNVVDIARKRVVRTYQAREFWQRHQRSIRRHPDGMVLHEFVKVAVTPDGEYLFSGSSECLHRFRIDRTELRYQEVGPRLGAPWRIEISPDSRYVTMAGVMTTNPIKNHPQLPSGALAIYRLLDLQNPVHIVRVGRHPRAFAFVPSRNELLGHNGDYPLLRFRQGTQPEKQYKLPVSKAARVEQILPHPNGDGALVLTNKDLLWVAWGR